MSARVSRCSARHVGATALLVALSCEASPPVSTPEVKAAFGVLFGGQLQRASELALELDRAKQVQGFRLSGPRSSHVREVTWELGTAELGRRRFTDSHGYRSQRRKVRYGTLRWAGEEPSLEYTLPFQPGDPTGLWNIRLSVDGVPVLDRPFWVYDAARRRRAVAKQRARDGGI